VIDPKLLEILVCPRCRSSLTGTDELVCSDDSCGLVYPVRDGVPVLLIDGAGQPS
jgi:uncharacterized protein YbaR (Trm112 family)